MADTRRTLAELQTLLADNTTGDISAQDARDFLVSVFNTHAVCQGRLTTESGVAVSTTDRTAQGTLYFTPVDGNLIGLYDGSSWKVHEFTERSLTLTLTSGNNYDVWLYDNAGTLTLETLIWTNDTTRATALVLQNGIWCKTGALTRRYLGTIRASAANVVEDSLVKRFVWNAYNQTDRPMFSVDATSSWTLAASTAFSQRGSKQLAVVVGLASPVAVDLSVLVQPGNSAGIAVSADSTTVAATDGIAVQTNATAQIAAFLRRMEGVGYHYYAWLEYALISTATFYGSQASPTRQPAAITGMVRG